MLNHTTTHLTGGSRMEHKALFRSMTFLLVMTVLTLHVANAADQDKTKSSSENPTSQSCVLDAE